MQVGCALRRVGSRGHARWQTAVASPRVRIVRFLGRGLWVSLLLLVHGVIWFGGWLGLVIALRPKARRQAWFAERLTSLLIALGATFVKVGWIMSM